MKRLVLGMTCLLLAGCSADLTMPYQGSGAQPRRPVVAGTPRPPAAAVPHADPTPMPPVGRLDQPDRQTNLELPPVRLPGMKDGTGVDRAWFESQQVSWRSCEDTLQCADILVPMDSDNPGGTTISLRLTRKKATRTPHLGVLFMNPGGPGDPGVRMVRGSWPGLSQYDLVAWDVRGTGNSTPVSCREEGVGDDATRGLMDMDTSPDDEAELQALLTGWKQFGKRCAERAGEYLRYLGTRHTVSDMDIMRAALGQERLNYLGFSYGTYLGSWYAHVHPDRVGRMVLDGAVDVTADSWFDQGIGFQRALQDWAEDAARDGRLGSTPDAVLTWLDGWLRELDGAPITSGKRTYSQGKVANAVIQKLYGQDRAALTDMLAGIRKQDYTLLDKATDDFRSDANFSPTFYSYYAIQCADRPDRGAQDAVVQWRETQRRAPIMGSYASLLLHCPYWPVRAETPESISSPDSATTILVLSTTGDPATPYEYGIWMTKALGNARLLSFDGPGHTAYATSSDCVDDAVEAYLRTGELPPEGTVCRS